MMVKIRYIFFALFILFLQSCSNKSAFLDPYAFAPKDINSSWSPLIKSTTVTSKYCTPLFPKEYSNEKLTLSELIDIALLNNPNTKQSWANARSAAALYGQSISPYFPEIDADASYTRERQSFLNTAYPLPSHGSKHQSYYRTIVEPEITLSYIIYDFGKRKSSSESAKQSLFYADWMHNRQLQDVMQTVMTSYYDYQFQKQSLLAFKADLENAEMTLDATNKKFILGTASIGDITQAKTKYLQTKMELIAQENRLETSYADLLNNLGVPSNRNLQIEDLPEKGYVEFVLDNLDDLIKKAQDMRQDFLAAQANVKYSQYQIDYAKSLGKPDINSYFEIGRNYYDKGIHEDYHFTAAFKLSIPIFKGFYFKNGIKSAEAKLLNAQALLQQTELEIVKEITISHSTVIAAADTLKYAKDYLTEAKKRFDIALANYKAGTGTILDVTAAQSSLADARTKDAKAQKDWYSSIATLAYSTGALCMPDNQIEENINES